MIRSAAPADMHRLLEMGQAFFHESGYAAETDFDHESTQETLTNLISGEDAALLVGEVDGRVVGMAGALAYTFYFNKAHKTGQELFWWVEPESRGSLIGVRLLEALEAWAHERGCATFTMVNLAALGGPVERIYERMGYRLSEKSYLKAV